MNRDRGTAIYIFQDQHFLFTQGKKVLPGKREFKVLK